MVKVPVCIKEYGWVLMSEASDISLIVMKVSMTTKDGHDLWAVYTAKGELGRKQRSVFNIAMPANVIDALSKSQYKDWKVVVTKRLSDSIMITIIQCRKTFPRYSSER